MQYRIYLTVLFIVFELIVALMLQLCSRKCDVCADEEHKDKGKRKMMSCIVKWKCWISWTGE